MALRGFKLLVILSLLCLSGVSAQEVERDPGGIFSEGQTTKLFDEAHFNAHTTEGNYSPFVNLIRNDGYLVFQNSERFRWGLILG